MPGSTYTRLIELAAEQYGYVTQADARGLGIPAARLVNMKARGLLEHRGTGVYRVPLIPPTALDPYMEATLWPYGVRGVLSHETALDRYELSDVNPDKIHITVPRHHRVRRAVPAQYVLHREDLRAQDTTAHEGIPVVTAARAIRQCHASHLRPSLIAQAIDDGARAGYLTQREAEQLRAELLQKPVQPPTTAR